MSVTILHNEKQIALAMAKHLREVADNVERMGLYDATLDTEDKADFKKGDELELRTYTHVQISLKIKRVPR